MTTIKVPMVLRDRLRRLEDEDGLTLAQEIERLLDSAAPRPKPRFGGHHSEKPLTTEEIDAELASGFGA